MSLILIYVKAETNEEEEKQDCHQLERDSLLDRPNLSMDFIYGASLNRTLPISFDTLDHLDEERIIETR